MGNYIVDKAREWIGTPWMHHQSLKLVGCDCAGFLFGVANECGIVLPPIPNHNRIPLHNELRIYLDKFLTKGEVIIEGDILLFKFSGLDTHLAIASDIGVIHACPFNKKVVEHCIDDKWQRRLTGVYKWERPELLLR